MSLKWRARKNVERSEEMKNKTGIIILFAIQALAIPFALFLGLIFLFLIVSFVEMDWTQIEVIVQTLVALVATLIGVLYIGTYIFSLVKTLERKRVSFISWLPILHGVITLLLLLIWNYVNELFK